MKTGLVMEGGSYRGMFTAGIIDVLMENGVAFDGAIGTSAGAVFGCNYKSHQIGRVIRYNKRFSRNWRYASFRSLLLTGDYFGRDFAYRRVPEELDKFDTAAFAASPMEFWITATDMNTGKPVYHRCDLGDRSDIEWMRASASMPGFSRPVIIDGQPLSDGGTADSIPLRYFESLGYARNVVILTQPAGYVKKPNAAMPLMRLLLRRWPALLNALAHRHEGYNDTTAYIAAQEAAGAALVIRPDAALGISATEHDPVEIERVYLLGRAAGEKHLAAVQTFLASARARA